MRLFRLMDANTESIKFLICLGCRLGWGLGLAVFLEVMSPRGQAGLTHGQCLMLASCCVSTRLHPRSA